MAHELVEYFAVRQDETLALLRRLVEFESPSSDKAALDRLGALIADQPTRTVKAWCSSKRRRLPITITATG